MKTLIDTTAGPAELLRADARGLADFGWLEAAYTFSFGAYMDPTRMGHGLLRVLNQDRVLGGGGFQPHGHRDMEIITWVQEGELVHEDSMGNKGVLRAGEVQVMSAGTGVRHSEVNGSQTNDLHLLQMWIPPAVDGTEPTWDQRPSPEAERRATFAQLVGPHAEAREGLLTIGQDARLYATLLAEGETADLTLPAPRRAYLHVARGNVRLGDGDRAIELGPGDGLALGAVPGDERALALTGLCGEHEADVVVWDLP